MREHLKFLTRGAVVGKPVYSFKACARIGYVLFEPSRLIVLEGLFALHDSVVGYADFKIFVDIAVHGSLLRRLIRDVGRTGQTERDIFRQYVERVYPMYKLHIEPTKLRADTIIVNQYIPEIETGNCRNQAFQIKARLGKLSSSELEKKLEELGFERKSAVLQEDTYYCAPGWGPDYSDELMRVRKEGLRCFLAYKGPTREGPFDAKPKIEFEVEPRLRDALEGLGYKKLLSSVKRREKFTRGDNLEIAFDDFLFSDGRFLEFRAEDKDGKAKILGLLEKLGIKEKDTTTKSYLELLLNKKTSG